MNVLHGDYLGCVTDANGCNWCSTYTVGYNVINNVVDSREGEIMTVHPNPFSSALFATIHVDDPENYILILIDDFGRKLLMQSVQEKVSEIDGSSLADGIYYLQLADKKTLQVVSRKKVMVVN